MSGAKVVILFRKSVKLILYIKVLMRRFQYIFYDFTKVSFERNCVFSRKKLYFHPNETKKVSVYVERMVKFLKNV
ncbi:hypothetical protein D7Y25_13625 [Parabacteroides goldsteinii]|nr:hypothetical protein [Parabacteroides goldsteinii]RKU65934.1 hypothetical protein DWW91_19590 [Parabacteroides sp. AF17-3]RLT84636.1 hypothetical protein D7Y25_13625 [Parabacteroides goldsteinii]